MAGVSTKEIKNRIRSMESTRQITKAMEMVAASKLRRAQAQVLSSRPYFETLYATIHDIVDSNRDFSSPYLLNRGGKKVAYIVIAGDRGLAGGYNSNILKLVMAHIQDKDAVILPIGRKTVDFFRSKKLPILTENYTQAIARKKSTRGWEQTPKITVAAAHTSSGRHICQPGSEAVSSFASRRLGKNARLTTLSI